MDNKVLEVALQAYMDGWCKSVEGTKRCIATWDDETDVAHARAGVRAAILAAMPVLLGNMRPAIMDVESGRVALVESHDNCPLHGFKNVWVVDAPSLGEGDGR